jgi:hypothetical protein
MIPPPDARKARGMESPVCVFLVRTAGYVFSLRAALKDQTESLV